MFIAPACRFGYVPPEEAELGKGVGPELDLTGTMLQIIKKNEEIISEATVQLVTVNKEGKPIKIPEILNNLLN